MNEKFDQAKINQLHEEALLENEKRNIEKREKEPIGKIIVIDDNYANNLAGIFEKEHEDDKEKPVIMQSTDCETALEQMRSVQDPHSIRILTDMYIPDKKGSSDMTEGLKVFGEIFEFYGVRPEIVKEKMEKVEMVIGNFEATRNIFQNSGDDSLDNFLSKILARRPSDNIYQNWLNFGKDAPLFPKDLKELSEEELEKRGILIRAWDGRLDVSDEFINGIGTDYINSLSDEDRKGAPDPILE